MKKEPNKPSILMAWIGDADIGGSKKMIPHLLGPIAQALREQNYSHAFLLSSRKEGEAETYKQWLTKQDFSYGTVIELYPQKLTSPTEFKEIYESVRQVINIINGEYGMSNCSLTFHLSPGTPIMAAVWIFLAKTSYPADLIVSSVRELGIQKVIIPYEITVSPEYVQQTVKPSIDSAPEAFNNIQYQCNAMRSLVKEACSVAPYDTMPVLILGESGTGKELFAKAIHNNSPRCASPFEAINCGAFNRELLQGELFGHEKGAFTGAHKQKNGLFEQACGGTIFLDEIGEMAKDLQVNLLRVIQEKKIRRIGGQREIEVDVRLIAATNKDIYEEVADGNFRADLFWRLAGKILELPTLQERNDDVPMLAKYFMERINDEYKDTGWIPKYLTPCAIDILCNHNWPGNVRELEHTIHRAAISSLSDKIDEHDIQHALLLKFYKSKEDENILNRPLRKGFNLENLLNEVSIHYIKRALNDADGKKTKAAELLGFNSHQKLNYWMNIKFLEKGVCHER